MIMGMVIRRRQTTNLASEITPHHCDVVRRGNLADEISGLPAPYGHAHDH